MIEVITLQLIQVSFKKLMGEAKRRKKLDPNYGKIPKIYQSLNSFPTGELVFKCYQQYGRGLYFNFVGLEPMYAKPSYSLLNSQEIELINSYNPDETIIIAELIDPQKLSRTLDVISISRANELKVRATFETIDEVVDNMYVLDSTNQPQLNS